ncbi:MAG: hypothetical protein QOG46_2104 [Pseudonocardiales bacterium]|jgi:hypothetical protein|nr:hypothetical protein [Pseudonocardiales bacterium]
MYWRRASAWSSPDTISSSWRKAAAARSAACARPCAHLAPASHRINGEYRHCVAQREHKAVQPGGDNHVRPSEKGIELVGRGGVARVPGAEALTTARHEPSGYVMVP